MRAIAFIFFFLLYIVRISGQSSYYSSFEGIAGGVQNSVVNPIARSMMNGDYIVVHTHKENSDFNLIISRYGYCDKEIWSKAFKNDSLPLQLVDIKEDSNGNIIVLGNVAGLNIKKNRAFLMVINKDGRIQLSKFFDFSNNNESNIAKDLLLTKNEIFICGVINDNNANALYHYLMILSKTGNIEKGYKFDFDGVSNSNISRFGLVNDHEIFVSSNLVAYRFSLNGNIEFSFDFLDYNSVIQKPFYYKDKILQTGRSVNNNEQYLYGLGSEGNISWITDAIESNFIYDIAQIGNNIICLGKIDIDTLGFKKEALYVATFNEEGDLIKKQIFYQVLKSFIFSGHLSILPDGTILVSGQHSDIPQNSSGFVIRFNLDQGLPKCPSYSDLNHHTAVPPSIFSKKVNVNSAIFSSQEFNIFNEAITLNNSVFCKNKLPSKDLLDPDTIVCFGEKVEIHSRYSYPNYIWSTGSNEDHIVVSKGGKYALEVFGNGCYQTSDTINVEYHPDPEIQFNVSPSSVYDHRPIKLKSHMSDTGIVKWVINSKDTLIDATSYYEFNENGRQRIEHIYTDKYGCDFSDSVFVNVSFVNLEIPNSFSPNDDGLNDCFSPEFYGIKNYVLTIFNQWGDLIYESNNKPWCPEKSIQGSFVYHLNFEDDFNKKSIKKGILFIYD